jgi:hypothetical protein
MPELLFALDALSRTIMLTRQLRRCRRYPHAIGVVMQLNAIQHHLRARGPRAHHHDAAVGGRSVSSAILVSDTSTCTIGNCEPDPRRIGSGPEAEVPATLHIHRPRIDVIDADKPWPAPPSMSRPRSVTLSVAAALMLMPFVPTASRAIVFVQSIGLDFVIVTAPKPPGSMQLMIPPAAVFEIAPAKVLQGAVREHGFASSPAAETHVRVA